MRTFNEKCWKLSQYMKLTTNFKHTAQITKEKLSSILRTSAKIKIGTIAFLVSSSLYYWQKGITIWWTERIRLIHCDCVGVLSTNSKTTKLKM